MEDFKCLRFDTVLQKWIVGFLKMDLLGSSESRQDFETPTQEYPKVSASASSEYVDGGGGGAARPSAPAGTCIGVRLSRAPGAVQSRASARSQALDATCVSRKNYVVHGDASFCFAPRAKFQLMLQVSPRSPSRGFASRRPGGQNSVYMT